MPQIAIYARKSTESEDRQVLSIDSQIKELQEFAAREKLGKVVVFTESKSAKAPGRPAFNELLKRVSKGEFDRLVCWKLDRLARNPVDGGAVIWAVEEGKIQHIYTPQRRFDNSGNDKFWMQLEFGMAKKYVDDLSDNVKRGLRAKVAQG
ncbi:MAG: recombinase family protein [bacterium]|nr:recombinase family protein [bacterium]